MWDNWNLWIPLCFGVSVTRLTQVNSKEQLQQCMAIVNYEMLQRNGYLRVHYFFLKPKDIFYPSAALSCPALFYFAMHFWGGFFTRVPPCLVLPYSTSPCIFGGFHIFTLEDICIHIYDWFLYINTRRHKTRQDKLRRCIELRQPNMTRYVSTRFAKINVRMELTCLFCHRQVPLRGSNQSREHELFHRRKRRYD